jgi:geranyl-CoA carboxylase alpha subunit
METATEAGYRTVAVYSEADADAPHVRAADDAVLIGPAPVSESYLSTERVLAAAKTAGAQAVHPGYGFLSENADFARACEAAGLVFIGPPTAAIELMGNKAAAKRRMIEAGVPCVPGYEGEDQSIDAFVSAAAEIGFPVMVKAAAGGGGRGMRLVEEPGELATAVDLARSEAENAFGSGELILEKAVVRPRHVEIQVFADDHGNVIHLGERDCSVQRRHQKVIEEAPCPVMTEPLRAEMGHAAVEAARAIGYRGAGTVEFLLDENGEFYFLEMNTRLQVEHPVTEAVTGYDLVELQIRVAQGAPLGISQEDVELYGHAIEVRLYAEDTANDFLPSTGTIDLWSVPDSEFVRVDSGVESGSEVSPFYDPMLAKVIAWGETREAARCHLVQALQETALFGPSSNRDFLLAALSKASFARGEATTAFISEEFATDDFIAAAPFEDVAAAAVLQYTADFERARDGAVAISAELENWSSSGVLTSRYQYGIGETLFDLTVSPRGNAEFVVDDGEREIVVAVRARSESAAELTIDGRGRRARWQEPEPGRMHVATGGRTLSLRNRISMGAAAEESAGGGSVVAPMHGMLIEVEVAQGDTVSKGDRLAVLEAMKMQHEIVAEIDGKVEEVLRAAGEQVAVDDLILRIEEAEA